MKSTILTKPGVLLIAAAMAIAAPVSAAENYPEKPITWIVPFSAGGGADSWTRIIALKAEEHFGQPFIIQNRPGGGGVMGWQELLAQPADGYTVIHGSPTPIITLVSEDDPIIQPSAIRMGGYIGSYETLLAAHAGNEWSTWEGLLEYAADHPGQLTVAGTNSPLLNVANIFDQAGVEVTYVPYQGTSDAISDFLGGHVDLLSATTTSVGPLIDSDVVAILNASDQQLLGPVTELLGGTLPPLATDLGYESSASPRWVGMHPDTPDEIVEAFSDFLGDLMQDDEVFQQIAATGELPIFTPAAEAQRRFDALVVQLRVAVTLLD